MRVGMILTKGSVPFEPEWSSAAACTADVVEFMPVRRLSTDALPLAPSVARVDGAIPRYEVAVQSWRPTRVLGRASDRATARRFLQALGAAERMEGPIDLLHGHFYSSRILPALHAATGKPFVLTEHSTALNGTNPTKGVSRAGLERARAIYASASFVLPVAESLLGAIKGFGLEGRFRVVPNPVDVSMFYERISIPEIQRHIELICVARLSEVKAHDRLLRAFARAREVDPRLRLTLVGDGPARVSLSRLCEDLGLTGTVRLTGSLDREEIAVRLRASHLFVLASYSENLPVAVIEAVCSGVPVVATDVGGVSDIIEAESGVLVRSGDDDALVGAILHVAGSLSDYPPSVVSARARSRFSREAVGRELGCVYAATVSPCGMRGPS